MWTQEKIDKERMCRLFLEFTEEEKEEFVKHLSNLIPLLCRDSGTYLGVYAEDAHALCDMFGIK